MRLLVNVLVSLALSSSVLFSSGAAAQNFKQPDPFGCGPAAAANCVKGGLPFYQGVCSKLPNPDFVTDPRPGWGGSGGVSRKELCEALNDYDGDRWVINDKGTLQDLKKICEGDGRAIVLIPGNGTDPGHFVTACEVVDRPKNPVVVIDPADGKKKRMKLAEPIVIIYPKVAAR